VLQDQKQGTIEDLEAQLGALKEQNTALSRELEQAEQEAVERMTEHENEVRSLLPLVLMQLLSFAWLWFPLRRWSVVHFACWIESNVQSQVRV
jgi:hypothetical protein